MRIITHHFAFLYLFTQIFTYSENRFSNVKGSIKSCAERFFCSIVVNSSTNCGLIPSVDLIIHGSSVGVETYQRGRM